MSLLRIAAVVTLVFGLTPVVSAQIMRFETSVGSFDMELNPNDDPNLQPLVDNIVAYIGLGRYHYTAINRADQGFVLQMGSFLGFPPDPNNFLGQLQEIERLDPVVVDGNGDGQVDFSFGSNTRGAVSLALSAGNPNSGTSSFFINIGDNAGLDSQGFVPFARIQNMAIVDRIMNLEQTNLTGDPNDLTFGNVPLQDNGRLVILKSVRVLQAAPGFSFVGPVQAALAKIQQANEAAAANLPPSQAALLGGGGMATPEPATAVLATLALAAVRSLRRRG